MEQMNLNNFYVLSFYGTSDGSNSSKTFDPNLLKGKRIRIKSIRFQFASTPITDAANFIKMFVDSKRVIYFGNNNVLFDNLDNVDIVSEEKINDIIFQLNTGAGAINYVIHLACELF